MTTTITIKPNEHPVLVTQRQINQHNGLHATNFRQEMLMPGDPVRQYHISKGGQVGFEELESTDERAVAEHKMRNPHLSDAAMASANQSRGYRPGEDPDAKRGTFKEEPAPARARAPAD